jgi:hypothetical protein
MMMKFSKRHSRGRFLALVLILTSTIATHHYAQASPSWPNEPAGSGVLIDCNFDTVTCGGQFKDVNGAKLTTLNEGGMVSPTNVLESVHGPTCGWCDQTFVTSPFSDSREVYFGFVWKTNTDFFGAPNLGNKIGFIYGSSNGTATGNNFFALYGGQGSNPFTFVYNTQGNAGDTNNCQVPGVNFGGACSPGTAWIAPLGGLGRVFLNTWYQVEIYRRGSTTPTSQDGILKVWLNGVLSINVSNMNDLAPTFNGWSILHTWGGPDILDTNHTWIHYFDHVHLSVPGGSIITGKLSPPTGLFVK